ncbi:MAG: TIGR02391 family protein [Candidatus Nanopelagicales bacterium]
MTSSDDAPDLHGLTAAAMDQLAVRLPVSNAAWDFLVPFYEQADLISAWSAVDPQLRLCWAQWWIGANQDALQAAGYDCNEVAQALVRQAGSHPLWQDFERVILRDFRDGFPLNPETWGVGTAERVIDSITEVLYALPEVPESGLWQPGETRDVVPLVMRHSAGRWRLLNLGYEFVPEPGWPPALWGPRDGPDRLSTSRSDRQTRRNDDPHPSAVSGKPGDGWARSQLERYIDMTSLTEPSPSGDRDSHPSAPRDDVIRSTVLIEDILGQVTPTWRQDVAEDTTGRWQQHRDAAMRAVAVLDLDPWTRAKLGEAPAGLATSLLHEWVWEASRRLWANGFFAEAVGAAARRVNAKTQEKLGRRNVAETNLFRQAFSMDPPEAGKLRLRLWEDDDSQTYKNVHRGAMSLAEGLFAAARNLAAHEDEYELTEQEALEQLVAFSLLARWVERAKVINA